MTPNDQRVRSARAVLPGRLACLCFLFLQFLGPLHLALREHALGFEWIAERHAHGESAAHGDGAHAHLHAQDLGHPGTGPDSEDGHDPHPIEDHFEALAVRTAHSNAQQCMLAPAPPDAGIFAFTPPYRAAFSELRLRPRPRPLERSSPPRAPPPVV